MGSGVEVEIRQGVVLPDSRGELFGILQDLGYEPHDVPPIEYKSLELVPLVIWVAENIGAPAALDICKAVVRWARHKVGDRADEGTVRVIYGPKEEILAEVRVKDVPGDG